MTAYWCQKEKVSKCFAFDPSKPSGGDSLANLILLKLVCHEPMSKREKISK